MHPALLLGIYCGFCVVASLSGGWVPLVVRLTHRRMQIAISFVAGMMLGIGMLHLLPHSFQALRSIDATVLWVMGGFLFMFFLERFFHFHHHDVADEEMLLGESRPLREHVPDNDNHHHDSHHEHVHAARAKTNSIFPWSGAVLGLTLHSLVDGVAMAAAVKAEEANPMAAWAGFGAFLAITLHKPFDSLTIGTLMAASGRSPSSRHLVNALYSLVTPLGVALFYLGSASLGKEQAGLGEALGFAAGAFVCIATSDLLPELQFHRHDRSTLSLALLAGIALAWSTVFFECGGHDHVHAPGTHAEGHDHDDH